MLDVLLCPIRNPTHGTVLGMSVHEVRHDVGPRRDAEELVKDVGDLVKDTVEDLKPRLRGWLHVTAAPVAMISLVVVLLVAEQPQARTGSMIFMVTAVSMFSTSAIFHTGRWPERAMRRWQRLDHANIFLLIAGSCTPFTMIMLDRADATRLLSIVWGGAFLGIVFKVLWIDAPRWLGVGLYVSLGSASLLYVPEFMAAGPPDVLVLMLTGAVLYTVGGLVYALRWPDPLPAFFGYHEVFHALTVTAFAVHCGALGLLLLG